MKDKLRQKEVDTLLKNFNKDVKNMNKKQIESKYPTIHPVFSEIINKFIPNGGKK